jgi:hypothetical protein
VFVLFTYFNKCRIKTIEHFFEDADADADADANADTASPTEETEVITAPIVERESKISPIKILCNEDNFEYYKEQYLTLSNDAFEDAYKKCHNFYSTIDLHTKSSSSELLTLKNRFVDLSESNNDLTEERDGLSNDLADSNAYLYALSNSNQELNQELRGLSNDNKDLESISNLLDDMDSYQEKINKLTELENIINSQLCDEMKQNCSLYEMEHFTKEKLEAILQNHINTIPDLSKAYILAVKMWVAYQKASGDRPLIESNEPNMESAIKSYNDTIELLKTAEESMYKVRELYKLNKDLFYYTTKAEAASNSTIHLNVFESSNPIEITFSNEFIYTPSEIVNNEYDALFSTCSSSNNSSQETISLTTGGENTVNIWTVTPYCSLSNYANIIENDIGNCAIGSNREDCVREQNQEVKSGLEYIYRSKFSRSDINRSTNTDLPENKNEVDNLIAIAFLNKVFNSN